jgi:predicted DNA binding CopG/RHH family protein
MGIKNLEKIMKQRERELLAFNPNYFEPIDDEERQISKDLENNNYVFSNDKKFQNELSESAKNYLDKKKKKVKPITIRADENVIEKIKVIASNIGLNYQSYLNMILYQVANGKIVTETRNTL